MSRGSARVCALMVLLMLLPGGARAQQGGNEIDGESLQELAFDLNSPFSSLFYLDVDIQWESYQGDLPESSDQSALAYRIAVAYPFLLDNGRNIVLRAALPVEDQPPVWIVDPDHPAWQYDTEWADWLLRQSPQITPDSGAFDPGFAHGHVNDMTLAASYGGISDTGLVTAYGLVSVLPTSQDRSSSREQWLLGPEISVSKQHPWGMLGVRASHLTRISGEDRWDTNETQFEFSFAYALGNHWQFISNPTVLYDWEADSGNELLLPVAAGVARMFNVGGMPMRMAAQAHYYVVSPDRFGPEWLFQLRFSPVFATRPAGRTF